MTKLESLNPVYSQVKDPELVAVRRRQIVRAAVDLFVEKGFHKTTTREISRECGFSIGTLYEYISSKEDVLYLVCDYIHSEVETRLTRALVAHQNGKETLRQAIEAYFKVMDELQDWVLIIYQELQSLPHDLMRHVLRKEEEITAVFERMIRKGMEDGSLSVLPADVHLMAHNIMVLGEMWTFRRWALRKQYTLAEYTEQQIALLLQK
jgi:AcrR family transcriptional regulator